MLLINRNGPPELAELFKRVNTDQMSSAIWAYDGGARKHPDQESLSPHELLRLYVSVVYEELEDRVNNALVASKSSVFGSGDAVVIYSPLHVGWQRGTLGSFPLPVNSETLEKLCLEAERKFMVELFEPFPDLARKFDKTIF